MTSNVVGNQKIVIIQKDNRRASKEHIVAAMDMDALNKAASLPQTAFKLWIYMDKNLSNYQFALSSADFCAWANVSSKTYRNAVKELIELDYLVPIDGKKENYTFYEDPVKAKERPHDKIIHASEEKIDYMKTLKDEFYNSKDYKF